MTFRIRMHAVATVVMLAALVGAATAEPLNFRKLNLINDWIRYSDNTRAPAVAIDPEDTVHLRGAIKQVDGDNKYAFVLPRAFRPKRTVYVRIHVLAGRAAMLTIFTNGLASIEAADSYADAQAFASLEGASFSRR